MSGKTRLYNIYHTMTERCCNRNHDNYRLYGGRGIKPCDEWINKERVPGTRNITKGWYNFKKWALENGYRDDLTIDRIDNDKGYSPDNCRWVTQREQANNKSNNCYITYKNETLTLSQWCEKLGLNRATISSRIYRGWTAEKAFETKIIRRLK